MIKKFTFLFFMTFFAQSDSFGYNSDCVDYSLSRDLLYQDITSNSSIAQDPETKETIEVCKNRFPTINEKMLFRRIGNDPFEYQLRIEREYCWARNIGYSDKRCYWGRWVWGLNYSATLGNDDVVDPSSAHGSRALKRGRMPGHHVCLKRYIRGATYLHTDANAPSNVNPGPRTKVCAYVVNSIYDACNSPLIGWNHALIGCVDVPGLPGPPTYNVAMPYSETPFVVDDVKLEDTTTSDGTFIKGYLSLGSTFDQPLIKLKNGIVNGQEILLRYKKPGYRHIDDIPHGSSFQNDANQIVYYASIDPQNPSKVCACTEIGCSKKQFIGCVDRPTPRQSGFNIVAEYDVGSNNKLYVRFAKQTADGRVIYLDAQGRKSALNDAQKAVLLDDLDKLTNTPAEKPLQYYYTLPPEQNEISISEYKSVNNGSYYSYVNDVGYFYDTRFEVAMQHQVDGKPIMVNVETPGSRIQIDGCKGLKIAENQEDIRHQSFTLLGGVRERGYCMQCPLTGSDSIACPVPLNGVCNDGKVQQHEPDAVKLFCPGVIISPSSVSNTSFLCLQDSSNWNIIDYKLDKACVQIPNDCLQRPNTLLKDGMAIWSGDLSAGQTALSDCQDDYGVEKTRYYRLQPKDKIIQSNFPCNLFVGDCNQIYANYENAFNKTVSYIVDYEKIAHHLNRNLNKQEVNEIAKNLSSFLGSVHSVTFDEELPSRKCMLSAINTDVFSQVYHSCKIKNSCSAVVKESDYSGFASWPKVRDLTSQEMQYTTENKVATFRIVENGVCKTGFKPLATGLTPKRECYIKYIDGVKVIEQWDDVIYPCIAE